MNFNRHSNLEGQHAFLSASKYHWINYDLDKLAETFSKYLAAQQGTRLHAFASEAIKLGIKLPSGKSNRKTMNLFVNDAIGFNMESEQILYYSENCFGTADAISFKQNLLRIHDLKTGSSATSMHQLEIYASLFCLEYDINPNEIDIELRIYQNDDVEIYVPHPEDILYIMDKIIRFDEEIDKLKQMGE